MKKAIVFLMASVVVIPTVLASDNGGYYVCDATKLASDNQCIFALSGSQPDDWTVTGAVPHNLDRNVGADFFRGIQKNDGSMITKVNAKPWANGDVLVETADAVTEDLWSGYGLIFELVAPLRDMMMYNPTALTADVWAKYTKGFTDCNVKTVDNRGESRGGGTPLSTSQVYEYMTNPNGADIHHFVLQYLEEGAIELVCLSTDLEMDHCDAVRETAGATKGVDRCNCWFDAYQAIYGECPNVDMAFTACSGTVATTVCADDVDEGSEEAAEPEPEPEEPEPEAPEPTAPPSGSKGAKGVKGAKGRRYI